MSSSVNSGWLVLDKPLNISSAHLLNRLKKFFPRKTKIGHAGTLDPLASGVLPVAIGEATKLISFIQDFKKTYLFEVTWGTQTTTDDREGVILHQSEKRPEINALEALLPLFIGDIEQAPPSYSAVKVGGKRSYALAREGKDVALTPRQVKVHQLTLLTHSPEKSLFEVVCGKGTYVRSLARDLGKSLGCYGHVSRLQRLEVGCFNKKDALDGNKLLETSRETDIQSQILSLGYVLDDIPEVLVSEDQACQLRNGQKLLVNLGEMSENQVVVSKLANGTIVAICSLEHGLIYPKRVLNV